MNKSFILLLLCLLAWSCFGQIEKPLTDYDGTPGSYTVSSRNSNFPVMLKVDASTIYFYPWNTIPNDSLGNAVFMGGTKTVSLSTRLKKDSLKFYRYSIIEDDKRALVTDALLNKVDYIWPANSSFPGYVTMDFGISNVVNKKLTLKIYKITAPSRITTVILYNKPLKSVSLLNCRLVTQGKSIKAGTGNTYFHQSVVHPLPASFMKSDKNIGISFEIKKTDVDFIYHTYLKYKSKSGDIITSDLYDWSYDSQKGFTIHVINSSNFNTAGDYELIVMPYLSGKNITQFATTIKFKVLPEKQPISLIKLILISFSILTFIGLIAGIAIFRVKKNSQKKIALAKQQMESAKEELSMVRSQLNPHFVFNALSGIQNLMNNHQIESANNYLHKFANLTRQILSENVLITIIEEAQLIEDYLAMEQLRSSFNYTIEHDVNLPDYVEIPVMLLQPFVENAVKHGVSMLKDQGKITIQFTRKENDIILSVTDNGKGFDITNKGNGLGLKLSEKRVSLLNRMYHECPILLEINSRNSGTVVSITLTKWL